ncbi:hypothetical protein PSECIP111951_03094 [Pseudoalteromonas holothuriae]|uniref:DUF368 domain-containing protein n=1 Tax=Pseudoalteromonas holothuriae TaxID=2963714 RepID=A0A9W4QYE1_9GAMM|nr:MULTISPECIES: DUF368 domain-containing protein [unclassified Pseudoalteromonas]CAH9059526.1 hypothetical protein PSECIP111854_02424 [Pseudoalteromonas sp. CIP111854]CAH9064288.1 hypothetical protein PSECIP111951_03094 [Pseudoalteromonas sp. CIP111951]
MGAADVVPGVSGGTIAFITGIYTRFLHALKSFDLEALGILQKSGLKAFWTHVDGAFLLTVFAGLITSAVSLAKLITYLLANHQLLVWSFFFGLIVASFVHVAKQVTHWRWPTVFSCIVGAVAAFAITTIAPTEAQPHWWMFFISGMIAICAMILPGISGSFILLLLGMYGHVLSAVTEKELLLVGLFVMGCAVGLMIFSRFLSWLLDKYQQVTFSLLAGFLLGSLNLLWPWKTVLSTYTNSHGLEKPLLQQNVSPIEFASVTGLAPQTGTCIALAIAGLLLILALEKLTAK